jgi:hypothetical protein
MVILEETTAYTDGTNGNHVYVFKARPTGRSAEAVAYVPRGQTKVYRFKQPLKLDLKGRTFKPLA